MSAAMCTTIQLKLTQLQPAACRIETTHTVTASNLFKYCEPCHGLILFKHHHPLHFDQQQVAELLCTAHQWFAASQQAHPQANYPFFLWNCLPRAGASQFHGHAQVMLSKVCACNDTLWPGLVCSKYVYAMTHSGLLLRGIIAIPCTMAMLVQPHCINLLS